MIRLRRWRFGRSSEVVDTSISPELPLPGGEVLASEKVPASSEAAPPGKLLAVDIAPRRRALRRPARVLPPELPRVLRVHAPINCQCPDCGRQLTRLGEDRSEQLDYVPGYFQVIRHIRPKRACGSCARIVQMPAPSRPIERGLPTAGLLAQVVSAKYADHCPLYRIWARAHIRYYESSKNMGRDRGTSYPCSDFRRIAALAPTHSYSAWRNSSRCEVPCRRAFRTAGFRSLSRHCCFRVRSASI